MKKFSMLKNFELKVKFIFYIGGKHFACLIDEGFENSVKSFRHFFSFITFFARNYSLQVHHSEK